jgi:WD40 repeat protein/predicted Ser/Thr protein kinase
MKTCPVCDTSYPSHLTNCPTHGAMLIESRDLEPGAAVRGKYRIVRILGRGGMGTVYLAQHILLDEPRALKFMSPEFSRDAKFLKRFRMEAKAASGLHHPNVVGVVDLDQAEDGSPFIAMEYVQGRDLRAALAEAPFPVERALAIAREVASGLTKAHARGIIHRDIKPANIMLARELDSPEVPKILDFGIAAMKERATAVTTHGIMLTPQYAAPEQWKGIAAQELDGRVDLYALGGVLYEMLTGRTAFLAHNAEGWLYQHLQVAPEAPSKARPELATWKGLDELVLRLLEKDREKRTSSAEDFVHELDAVRSQTPISPAQENPIPSAPLLAGVAGVGSPALPETTNRPASISKRRPTRQLLFGIGLCILVGFGIYVAWSTAQRPTRQAQQTHPTGQTQAAAPSPPQPTQPSDNTKTPEPSSPPAPEPPPDVQLQRTLTGFTDYVLSVAFSPDSRWLASGSGDTIKLWDVNTGQEVRSLRAHAWYVTSLAFSPDGQWLASGSEENEQHAIINLWDPVSGRAVRTFTARAGWIEDVSVAFSPDGRRLASASRYDSTINLWDAASGRAVRSFTGQSGNRSLAFSPDGRWLAVGRDDDKLELWDVASGQEVRTLAGHTGSVFSVAFSPDGRTLASGSVDGTIRLWDPSSGREVRTLSGHTNLVLTVAFSPDGRWLASGSRDNTIKIWNAASGQELRTLTSHSNDINEVAFSPDGRWLASGSEDKTIKLWKLTN